MSFGFGLGLPHYVAILGSSGTTTYFISLTSSTGNNLFPYTLDIDSSDNIFISGGNTTTLNGIVLKINSSGTLNLSDSLALTNSGAIGLQSNGIYFLQANSFYCCCCSLYNGQCLISLNTSSLSKIYGARIGGCCLLVTGSKPTIDSSGNIYFVQYNKYNNQLYADYIVKTNSTLSSITKYANITCSAALSTEAIVISSTDQLIYAGTINDSCVHFYAYVASVPASNPTASATWVQWDSTHSLEGYFNYITLDSSDNVYASLAIPAAPTTNGLIKINSSGTLLWQIYYSGVSVFSGLATDSSGNVYAVGVNITLPNAITVVKINSSGGIVFARKLLFVTGAITVPKLTVKGSVLYITAKYTPATGSSQVLTFKTDTTGTSRSGLIGAYAFTYNSDTVSSFTTSYPFSTTGYLGVLTAQTQPINTSLASPTPFTASNAVTVL